MPRTRRSPGGQAGSQPETRTFPAGTYVLRMDQPYSRIADTLLDYQYWAPDDPQRNPYDDTGWTFGELFNVKVVRVTDAKVLDAPLELVKGDLTAAGGVSGTGSLFAINHNADPSLATLRYRFKDAQFDVAEEPFEAEGQKFNRGSFIIRGGVSADDLGKAVADLGLKAVALAAAPSVKTHPARAARIALMHTWINTQDEGWWRLALDQIAVPYAYISTQDVAEGREPRVQVRRHPLSAGRSRVTASSSSPACRCTAIPCPWKTTELTPNIGKIDSTDDMRPGMGWQGLANLQKFVRDGGVLITVDDTANFAIQFGFTAGVSVTPAQRLKITGAVLRSKVVDGASPIAYGYDENLSIYSSDGPIFGVSNTLGGRGGRGGGAPNRAAPRDAARQTSPTSRKAVRRPIRCPRTRRSNPGRRRRSAKSSSATASASSRRHSGRAWCFRYGDARDLLVSGLLDGGAEIAQRPMVVDVPVDKGHVVLFSNNPIWRGETHGSYFLVLNAILNHDNLNAGTKAGRALTCSLQDLKYTRSRRCARTPGFTAVAVLTLGLGIGATTAIFSVVHGVLMKPLPYREPERLANIWVDLGVGNQSLPAVSPATSSTTSSAADALRVASRPATGPADRSARPARSPASDGRETERVDVVAGLRELLLAPRRRSDARTSLSSRRRKHRAARRSPSSRTALWARRYGGRPFDRRAYDRLDGLDHTVVGVHARRRSRLLLPGRSVPRHRRARSGSRCGSTTRRRRRATSRSSRSSAGSSRA